MTRPTRSLPPALLAAINVPLFALADPGACVLAVGYFAAVSIAALFSR